jgi:hypothetical protein
MQNVSDPIKKTPSAENITDAKMNNDANDKNRD